MNQSGTQYSPKLATLLRHSPTSDIMASPRRGRPNRISGMDGGRSASAFKVRGAEGGQRREASSERTRHLSQIVINSGYRMRPDQCIVTKLPLSELWDETGALHSERSGMGSIR